MRLFFLSTDEKNKPCGFEWKNSFIKLKTKSKSIFQINMLKPKALSEVLAQVTNGGIQSTVYVYYLIDLINIIFLSCKDY